MKKILENKGVILFYTILFISTLILINDNKNYDKVNIVYSNETYLTQK